MPASRTDGWREEGAFVVMESGGSRVDIAGDHVQLRKNGVEFWSPTPVELWTEMTVAMGPSGDCLQKRGSGVVVCCDGDRHRGYRVSVLFLEWIPELGHSWKTAKSTLWS